MRRKSLQGPIRQMRSPFRTFPQRLWSWRRTKSWKTVPAGSKVGEFVVSDPDDLNGSGSYSFALVDGNGSDGNDDFQIDANGILRTAVTFDYETENSDGDPTLRIRVRMSDDHNASLEVPLVVKVKNAFVPIVRTLPVETDGNGTLNFRGKILVDGGSDVTAVGVKVSADLGFSEPIVLLGNLEESNDEFSVAGIGLESGKKYYYRAYATNAEGTSEGARKRFTSPEEVAQQPWWANSEEAEAGWRASTWFGAFRPYDNGWIYHADLGWLYAQPDGADGLWVWIKGKGWLWTNPGSYRYLYRAETHQWLYFLKRKDGPASLLQPRHRRGGVGCVYFWSFA